MTEFRTAFAASGWVGRFLLRVRPDGSYLLARIGPDDTIDGPALIPVPGINAVFDEVERASAEDTARQIAEMEQDD